MNLLPLKAAISKSRNVHFGVSGGTGPYTFELLDGSIGEVSSAGIYTAPDAFGRAVVQVTDSENNSSRAVVMILDPLRLLCDIIQTELELADGKVFIWDQKIFEPTDEGMFVVIELITCKFFGNTNRLDDDGNAVQSTNVRATLSIDIKSRGTEALMRKEEVILALNSVYSQQQQEGNCFRVATLPDSMVNLSQIDGAAIPYRFNFSVGIQYNVTKTKGVPYFDTFADPSILVDP